MRIGPRLTRLLKGIIVTVLLLAFAGCARYVLVKADNGIKVGNVLTCDSPIKWSKSDENGVEVWTVDGPQLQRLMFFKGVQDGKPLIKMKVGDNKNMPVYRSTMTSLEVMELVEATLARTGGHQIQTMNLRPESVGGRDGFRFELEYTTEKGLEYNGFVIGLQKNDKLVAVMYFGTALYHYGKHLEDVEKLISSVEIL